MLLASQEGSSSGKRTELARWRRFAGKPNAKRVEKASEFAVSKVFSSGNSDLSKRLLDQIIDLEAAEQVEDDDEVYAEAQELVNEWLDIKLKQELASDGEGDAKAAVSSISPVLETHHHLKYDKFDDLCDYLEEEEDGDAVKKFIDHLLRKDVVDSGVLDDLRVKGNQDVRQQKDPRLTMEMRQKQVKENRLRREKELERQRIERNLKKSALLEAQYLVQEEKKRKALEARKEEEEIRREMVKLRREIIERRVTVEEAWKLEKKKQELSLKNPEKCMFQNVPIQLDEEKMAKEKKKKLKELLIQTFKDNHQCQKRYFSAWHKLIQDRRIELGKAGTLSDWKLQLKILRAWRDHTRSLKAKREMQAMEKELREENRKQQMATEYNRKQVLRHHFTEWQHWLRAETLKRELTVAKAETRKKMNELLEAVSLGQLCSGGSSASSAHPDVTAELTPPEASGEVTIVPPLWEKPLSAGSECMPSPPLGTPAESSLQLPLHSAPDRDQPQLRDAEPDRLPNSREKLTASGQKEEPICVGRFQNRHVFQQQLIEKQKKKLQEQKKIILELKEKQRLTEARWAAELATAVTSTQLRLLSNPRTCRVLPDLPGNEESQGDSRNSLSGPKKSSQQKMAPHPILKAMEERAVQRTERRRILAEKKKLKEEEKLAQLKAQEEERQKREAEEKEAQLKKKREEKRLIKMKELEKQKRIKRNQQLEAIAKEHYKRVLLRKKGLEPWKKLRMQSKQNLQVAREHYSLALQRKYLLTWFQCSRENLAKRTVLCEQFYSRLLLRRAIRSWAQYLADMKEEIQKIYEHFLQKKIFRAWCNIAREAKIQSQRKQEIAVEHHTRRTACVMFQTWKTFTRLMKEERVKEERREQLRRKVAEILPDFRVPLPP